MRVVTINTGKGDGPYRRRVELLAEGLAALAPDLVLLQEALATPDGQLDTTRDLATALGMVAVFAPARRKGRLVEGEWLDTWSGLGILARSAPDDHEPLALPDHPDDGERIALLARWSSPGLTVANVHLTHLRGQDALRHEQLAALLAHPWLAGDGRRLLGGDLNTTLAELPALLAGHPVALRDLAVGAGDETARATVPVGVSGGRCVDYVLAVDDDRVVVTGATVVLDRPDGDGIFPSDHAGVMVELGS